MADQSEKTRETRLRRAAQRQGLAIQKSRRRDLYALDYGRWFVVDADREYVVVHECDSLDDVERYLLGERGEASATLRVAAAAKANDLLDPQTRAALEAAAKANDPRIRAALDAAAKAGAALDVAAKGMLDPRTRALLADVAKANRMLGAADPERSESGQEEGS